MKKAQFSIALFLAVIFTNFYAFCASEILLTSQEAMRIGERIYENECASKEEYLAHWNDGEDFLSLGIGHFIWYPKGRRRPFKESFPGFLEHAKGVGAEIPKWLEESYYPHCPWRSREEFLHSQDDPRLFELREFLIATKPQQAAFMVKLLQEALPLMLKRTPKRNRENLTAQFNRVASTPSGVYALVDYANFKGLGIMRSERYARRGWGLLQVLLQMRDESRAPDALKEFVSAANKVLSERANNAPFGRNEQRWLAGWQRRLDSYLRE